MADAAVDQDKSNRLVCALYADLVRADGQPGYASAMQRVVEHHGWRALTWSQFADGDPVLSAQWPQAPAPESAVSVEYPGSELGQVHRFQAEMDEADSAALEAIAEVLVSANALAVKIAAALGAAASPDQADKTMGYATVTETGVLLAADAQFELLMRREYRGWDGRKLPFEVQSNDAVAAHGMVVGGLWVRVRTDGRYLHLGVRPDRRAHQISPREYDIVARLAEGLTFKEIGRQLELAPSTVSTHVYNLYAKLSLNKRSELIAWFQRHKSGQGDG